MIVNYDGTTGEVTTDNPHADIARQRIELLKKQTGCDTRAQYIEDAGENAPLAVEWENLERMAGE